MKRYCGLSHRKFVLSIDKVKQRKRHLFAVATGSAAKRLPVSLSMGGGEKLTFTLASIYKTNNNTELLFSVANVFCLVSLLMFHN